jgi:16S rRNA (guanine(966)-N(2))-methyltransferase RsmD
MRIIAGKYKSRIIKTIKSYDTRPVLDRIKESIFNILIHKYPFEDGAVLDLFAGSGSFGLEALSRGAEKVTFVEKSSNTHKILLENINNLGCQTECSVYKRDVIGFIEGCSEKFDLIFCDPPFKTTNLLEILKKIYIKKILKEQGLLIFRSDLEFNAEAFKFQLLEKRKIGINIVYFLR